jgi:hypothetical protein
MSQLRRVLRFAMAWLVIVVVVLAGRTGTVLADGDPASDLLVGSDVALPFPVPSKQTAAPLLAQVESVYAAGHRIKVAVIATGSDLGSIPSLLGHPSVYAHFLGAELSSIYVGPLLIVMPVGFGIYDAGGSTAAEQRILKGIRVHGARADDLTRAATAAVAVLLKAGALTSKDRRAPIAYPQPSVGTRGQAMKLNYQVIEDSERSSVVVNVLTSSLRVASFRVPLQRVMPQTTYSVTWHVPQTLPEGPFKLCVSGSDASGNKGQSSCMVVQIN